MKLSDLFDENAFFRSDREIKEYIKNSKNYAGEDPNDANLLKFFSTSKQRTYLVITNERVYCILDDKRKSSPNINWSERLSDFAKEKDLGKMFSTREKTPNTGFIDFGIKHQNWLFTKSLFNETNIEQNVIEILNVKINT